MPDVKQQLLYGRVDIIDEKAIINLTVQMPGALMRKMIVNVPDFGCSMMQAQQFVFFNSSYIEIGEAVIGPSYKTM